MKNKCIREEHIIDYLENRLTGALFDQVERHLSECDACLDAMLVITHMSVDKQLHSLEPAPRNVTDQAVATVLELKQGPSVRRIVKQLKCNGLNLKNSLYDLIRLPPPERVHVRSNSGASVHRPVILKKSLIDSEAEIEIRKEGDQTASIRVELIRNDDRHRPVRVTLLEGDREISSYPLTEPALFEGVLFGKYILLFTREGVKAGQFRFRIEDSLNG
jgi:hypothetical protein